MANILQPFFYGMNSLEYFGGVQGISLQFHITAECDQSCKHCYMYNSPYYQSQINNPMNKETMFSLHHQPIWHNLLILMSISRFWENINVMDLLYYREEIRF